MLRSRADLDAFRTDARNVAALLAAEGLFGLLSRSLDVPSGWIALVGRTSGEARVYAGGATIEGNGISHLLLVRSEPVQIELVEDRLPCADGYQCTAHIRLWIRVVGETGDLDSFRTTVLGSGETLDVDQLASYVRWHCRRAITQFAEARSAADLVDGRDRDAAAALIAERLKPPLFAAGMALHQPALVRFECPALVDVRARAESVNVRQRIDETLAEARRKRLTDLESLLGQLQALGARSPGVELGELLRMFNETQRGQLYGALWSLLPVAERTQWIAVVAGNDLLCFDPNLPDAPARRVELNGPAGALRSVRVHQPPGRAPVLLVGAARGVYEIDADTLRIQAAHTFVPGLDAELRGGVNAAAIGDGHVFATHSEIGLMRWPVGVEREPEFLLQAWTREARTTRQAQIDGNTLWLAIDDQVVGCPVADVTEASAKRLSGSRDRITALHAAGPDVFAGNKCGDILHWRIDKADDVECLLRGDGSPVEAVQHVLTGGVPQVAFAERGTPAIQLLAIGDTFVCRYEAGAQDVRRCAVAGDLLVAINDTRDRLLCWRPGETGTPFAQVRVSAQYGHSIQDVCLVRGGAST